MKESSRGKTRNKFYEEKQDFIKTHQEDVKRFTSNDMPGREYRAFAKKIRAYIPFSEKYNTKLIKKSLTKAYEIFELRQMLESL